jgi:hypothetical protein
MYFGTFGADLTAVDEEILGFFESFRSIFLLLNLNVRPRMGLGKRPRTSY